MCAKFKGLSETEQAVVETVRMRLSEKNALLYLASDAVGFPMSRSTYYRHLRNIKKVEDQRLYLIASQGYRSEHIGAIDDIALIKKEMWKKFLLCQSPYQSVLILKEILNLIPYQSSYYDATHKVIENVNFRSKPEEQDKSVSIYQSNKTDGPITESDSWV